MNHVIIDKEGLKENDLKEKTKKKRFEIRYDLENFYREKNLEGELKKEKSLENKLSYNRYKTTDNRGYDIVNFGNNYENYKNMLKVKDSSTEWETILEKTNDKQTFTTKGIYKDAFDFSDNDKVAHQFKVNRKSKIYF